MLQQYSDEENPLSATDLIERLQNDYGIRCERKSIYADILKIDIGLDPNAAHRNKDTGFHSLFDVQLMGNALKDLQQILSICSLRGSCQPQCK